jgi:bifunctional non-homologous end joining protein LigD
MSKFSVQLHEAERAGPHWDVRFEKGGVAESWSIPKHKFPVTGEKVLAVEVPDHPISYMTWEGTIPKGQYGAGTVSVHDSGEYTENEWTEDKVDVTLRGKKLSGRYVFVRMNDDQWLVTRPKEQKVSEVNGKRSRAIPIRLVRYVKY